MKILSQDELESCKPRYSRGGTIVRAYCPFHGSDKQRSLWVHNISGKFCCFQCHVWGYMDWAREKWLEDQGKKLSNHTLTVEDFRKMFEEEEKKEAHCSSLEEVKLPEEFLKLYPDKDKSSYFGSLLQKAIDYLHTRGISDRDILRYDLRFCIKGKCSGRVIVPITMCGKIYGWVGRAIDSHTKTRYLNSESNFSQFLFNIDNVTGDTVIICEGVFDAMAVGENAVAVFKKELTKTQRELISRFKHKIIFFDSDAMEDALRIAREIDAQVALIPTSLVEGKKKEDPSSLGTQMCQRILEQSTFSTSDPDILQVLF